MSLKLSLAAALICIAATPLPALADDAASGEALFSGKAQCSACHQVNARGGAAGPDLSNAARLSADALRQKIVNPSANANPGGRGGGPSIVVVKTKAGQEIRGVRRAEDTFTLLLMDASGKLLSLDKRTLADQHMEQKSLMPADYAQRLSDAEIGDVVAYLRTLNGRDPAKIAEAEIPGGLTLQRLRNAAAEPQNWPTYWGDYQGRHFSGLNQITASNAAELQARWAVPMGDGLLEGTPLVVDGIMYTSGLPGQVFALDAKSGLQIWRYQRQQKVTPQGQINRFNRGVAMLGNRLFVGTLDAALVALDARTGQLLWETQIADSRQGYSITSAPLALKDKIVVGVSGGEFGANGFIEAYDPASGKKLWRFDTVPAPGEFGHETWKGDSWQHGASPTWLTGSYDPDLDTLFWTVGNPGPDIDADVRSGDNLFSCSVLALDPATGRRKWHYQFTPGDSHDWDSTEDVMLVDRMFHGQPRKLLMQANRNGVFYVLDRTNGEFLAGTPFVRVTWNTGFDANGRPKVVPGWDSRPEGSIAVYPALGGGTNFQAPSYSPATGWVYMETSDSGQRFTRTPQEFEEGRQYQGGRGAGLGEPVMASIKAIDPETGETKWEYRISRSSLAAGVLATAGNVVFAATGEGNLIALDARTGAALWYYSTGATMAASPMSYAVDGKQFVAISAGGMLYSFALPELPE